ncbi:MAG: ankyrin repeat domain-containing protein [Longimicrobiales bacterium]
MDSVFHPAMAAAYRGDGPGFAALLDAWPGLVTGRSGCSHPTLLQFVCVEGGLGKVPDAESRAGELIERGAALDEPLVAAASVGSSSLVALLLERGASVEACAPWTPLEEAVYWGHAELAVRLRTEHGAAVGSLRAAAGLGDLEAAARFFDEEGLADSAGPVRFPWGVRSEAPGDVLDQALAVAAANGQDEMIRFLVERGANPSAFPPGIHHGGTALHLAALAGHATTVACLVEAGADPSLRDERHGSTAAGWAEHDGHLALARWLATPPPRPPVLPETGPETVP